MRSIDTVTARQSDLLDRFLSRAAIISIVLALPSSLQASYYEDRLEYDTLTPLPSASSTTIPATENTPFVTPSSSPQPTTYTPDRDCRAGIPITFTWEDLGVHNAPVELVGVDESNNSIAAPTGRGEDGGYNTVGWYKDGPRPGADEGTPFFVAHSTRNEKSLFYPRDKFTMTLDEMRAMGKSTTILIGMDNGSTCSYEIKSEDMLLKVAKDKDYNKDGVNDYTETFRRLYSEEPGNERPIFNTCMGSMDLATGTSEDSAFLQGSSTN